MFLIDITSLVRDLGAGPLIIGLAIVAILIYSLFFSGKGGKSGGSGSSSGGSSTPTPPPAPPANPS